MTSLYGVTQYTDYEYIEDILFGRAPASYCDRGGCVALGRPVPSSELAEFIRTSHPAWFRLFEKCQMLYVFGIGNLTVFIPPDKDAEVVSRQWTYGDARRLLMMLIVERPIPPTYLMRSRGYKLYTFRNMCPVLITSCDGVVFNFNSPSCRISDPVRIPTGRTDLSSQWVYRLSCLPPIGYQIAGSAE